MGSLAFPASHAALGLALTALLVSMRAVDAAVANPVVNASKLVGGAAVADGYSKPLKGLTKTCYPFSFGGENGTELEGYTIKVVSSLNAKHGGLNVEWESVGDDVSFHATIDMMATGRYNILGGCFSRTFKRETEQVDFSFQTFQAGSALLQRRQSRSYDILNALLQEENVTLYASLFTAIIIFANLVWFFEHRVNEDFQVGGRDYPNGVWHGMWFMFVTFTTVGYGDKTPNTNMGKMVTLMWMMAGIAYYSFFSASITSFVSASIDTSPKITWADLQTKNSYRVATIRESSYIPYVKSRRVQVDVEVASEVEGYKLLRDNKIDVFIWDWPILRADVKRKVISLEDFQIVEAVDDDSYALAFPHYPWNRLSPNQAQIVDRVNSAIIDFTSSEEETNLKKLYFAMGDDKGREDDDDEGDHFPPPRWNVQTATAFVLMMVYGGMYAARTVWVRRKKVAKKAAKKAAAETAGVRYQEEDDEDEQVGGVAKGRDIAKIIRNMKSLEDRLVEAGVIKDREVFVWKKQAGKLNALRHMGSLSSSKVGPSVIGEEEDALGEDGNGGGPEAFYAVSDEKGAPHLPPLRDGGSATIVPVGDDGAHVPPGGVLHP